MFGYTLEDARNIYSDYHKEAYGFRPRGDISHMSLADFEEDFNSFDSIIAAEREYQNECENAAIKAFEAAILNVIAAGAGDRSSAIRWMRDARGEWARTDRQYFEYTCGLPYGYLEA